MHLHVLSPLLRGPYFHTYIESEITPDNFISNSNINSSIKFLANPYVEISCIHSCTMNCITFILIGWFHSLGVSYINI